MARLVVFYKTPKDKEAFDRYYHTTHVPLAKKIPGLRKYDISQGTVQTPAGPSDVHLVATLSFDSVQAIASGMGSPEGLAAAGDIPNFADGGTELYMFETREL